MASLDSVNAEWQGDTLRSQASGVDETQPHPDTFECSNNKGTVTPNAPEQDHEQAVRFSSVNQEIEPAYSLQSVDTLAPDDQRSTSALSPEAYAEIRSLSRTLQDSHLQHRRMSHFAFEPVSLPVSRVPSNEAGTPRGSSEVIRPERPSPRASTSGSMHTPPLTPAPTRSRDAKQDSVNITGPSLIHPLLNTAQITPQTSSPQRRLVTGGDENCDSTATSITQTSRPSSASEQLSTRQTSLSQEAETTEIPPNHAPKFLIGPSGDSVPPSRDVSPTGTPAPGSGAVTPPTSYSRPFTPVGNPDDPYARSKRPPQSRNLDSIDARFIFGGKDSRRNSGLGSAAASLSSLPRSNSGNDLKTHDKRHSTFSLHTLGGKRDENPAHLGGRSHGSMSDLKRFFRIGHHKDKGSQSVVTAARPPASKLNPRTAPHQLPPSNVPFADDHGLQSKYGKFGKVLGSGAGGSVRLMKRSSDGVTFAVKQFRERHTYESEKEYSKKVTAEFCIGSTLHHGNIIETLDIIHEKGSWFEVMEFAPYDLFAIVMTGKMSREEIACSFLQIFSGVTYLHSMGLAHRDLKLDNVVVNEHGIMKLIDFGSATVFRYPFENDIVLASGVVGSDPYLAPEVYDERKYDPQPTDIWSLAIIFACMSLRRFPWKAPRISDNSFKLFISAPRPNTPPGEGHLRRISEQRPKSMLEMTAAAEEARRKSAQDNNPEAAPHNPSDASNRHSTILHQPPHHSHQKADGAPAQESAVSDAQNPSNSKPEVIRGPWRLLRLLPRESRAIMGRMLEVNPRKRATLEEMLEDPWICNTPVCRQVDGKTIVKAEGHGHTLEPGTASTPAPSRK